MVNYVVKLVPVLFCLFSATVIDRVCVFSQLDTISLIFQGHWICRHSAPSTASSARRVCKTYMLHQRSAGMFFLWPFSFRDWCAAPHLWSSLLGQLCQCNKNLLCYNVLAMHIRLHAIWSSYFYKLYLPFLLVSSIIVCHDEFLHRNEKDAIFITRLWILSDI